MHDEILDNIVANAFNGNDVTGSDDFGCSFAWIDLLDFLENYQGGGERDTDELSAEFIDYNDGHRYAIAYLTCYGERGLMPYDNKESMMREFHARERAFIQFEDRDAEDENEGEIND